MLAKTDWAHLIPHQGAMSLLDAVVRWDDTMIHAISGGHARADHPLRSERGLHALHLIEYGAQAMAVHGALLARTRGHEVARPGRLVSVRDVTLAAEYVDALGSDLDIHAERFYADESGAQYSFRVEHEGHVLASGRAMVIHTDL
jgi:predicted hotdog family 3-hydroxylacyl-ACP dehydratase